jgi:hypothetical protein
VPNGSHTLTAVATDAAGNVATASPVTVTVNNAAATSNTIWPASAVPGTVSSNDSTPVELGLKFQSNVATTVTGVRFYKSTSNTGTHVGSLWTSAGTSLATVTFTNETASGWQQASFSSPVAIAANTTYVIGYHTLTGHYSDDNNYFATSGVASGPLTALSNSAAGGNGVYAYGASVAFPTLSYESTNYWVDVVTSGTSSGGPTPPTVPTNLSATAVNSGLVDLAWTASTDNVGVKGYDIYREGTLIGTSATNSYADSTVAAGTTYSYTVSAYDTVGNVSAQSAPASVTTPASGSTIFSDNFPGTSLSSAWTVIVRHGEYAQGETECNVPGAVAVASNTLSNTTTAQSATCGDFNLDGSVRHAPTVWPYTTGDVQWTSFNFTYGTVTYRAKFPAHATGTWPAIWFLGSNCQATNIVTADTGYSTCSQIESPGYEEIDSTECYQTEWCQLALAQPSSFPVCLYPVDTNWHTYSMIWTPTSVSVTIDGQPTGCDFTSAAGYVIPSKPMFMIVQTQTGGSGGTPDNANLPALLQVSDVTVTQP